jgi:TIR domain
VSEQEKTEDGQRAEGPPRGRGTGVSRSANLRRYREAQRSKPVAKGGRIFISYRRQESGYAGRLYDRLAARFGEARVFFDVDTMKLGANWRREIFREAAACRVLLAVISPGWLTAADGRGSRRLDDPDDIVRLEIETALTHDVLVIPVLVEGAAMPAPQNLPESLTGLTEFNALPIRHESFRYDTDRLVTALSRELTLLFLSSALDGIRRCSDLPRGQPFTAPDRMNAKTRGKT